MNVSTIAGACRRVVSIRPSRTSVACAGIWSFGVLLILLGGAISLADTDRPDFQGMNPAYRAGYEAGYDLVSRMGEIVLAEDERPGGWWGSPEARNGKGERKRGADYSAAFQESWYGLVRERTVSAGEPALMWRDREWNPIPGAGDLLLEVETRNERVCEAVVRVVTRLPFSYVAARFEMSLTPHDGGERRWRPVLQSAWPTDVSPCEAQFDGDRWRGQRDKLTFRLAARPAA